MTFVLRAAGTIVLAVLLAAIFVPDGRGAEDTAVATRAGATAVVFVITLAFLIGRKRRS